MGGGVTVHAGTHRGSAGRLAGALLQQGYSKDVIGREQRLSNRLRERVSIGRQIAYEEPIRRWRTTPG
jgi:hypothetical protein